MIEDFASRFAATREKWRDDAELRIEREAIQQEVDRDERPAIQTCPVPAEKKGTAQTRLLSEVTRKSLRYLWKPRIPRGMLTMFDGNPEMAKSTIALEFAARLSRAREFPDGQRPDGPGRTLILSAEDPAETVLRPRFDDMGGDPDMVMLLESVKRPCEDAPDLFSLASDVPILEDVARRFRPDLVVVDPITAYLGAVDSWKDQAVRRALGPLAQLAELLDFALLVIRHLNKNVNVPALLYRGGGSIGLIAAARSGLISLPDPDEPEDGEQRRRLLAHYKCNVAKKSSTLAYRIVSSPRDPDLPEINWLGVDARSADAIYAAGSESLDEKSARGDARHFLRELLASEGEVKAEDVFAEAKRAGHSEKTLRRAAKDLSIAKRKEGFKPAVWWWRLP